MAEKYSCEQNPATDKAETTKKKQIQVVTINQPSKEESKAKIKELSEFLSVAWLTLDNPK